MKFNVISSNVFTWQPKKEALTHVSDTDHKTRSALVIGDHSMLTELYRLNHVSSAVLPTYTRWKHKCLIRSERNCTGHKIFFFNQILFQFNPVPVRLHG